MEMQHQRVLATMALGALLCGAGGCHISNLNDPNRPLAARVRTNDAAAARQLAAGFYGIENNAWRWTAGKFAVVLPVSEKAKANGATLNLKLFFPAGEMAQLGSTMLSAEVNGVELPPETFSKTGQYTYTRDVPAAALAGPQVRVNFALSKSMPSTAVDKRELGAVVQEISLKAK